MAKQPSSPDGENMRVKHVRMVADKATLTVNVLTLAAGTIKVVRHASIEATAPEDELVFDELNADEFTMRYAD